MNNPSVPLKEVDRVEILTVIDNYVDVLLTNAGSPALPCQKAGRSRWTPSLQSMDCLCW